MTLLAAVFHLCAAANPGHVNTACRTTDVMAWTTTIRREASSNGLDPYVVAATIQHESGFRPKAQSNAGAVGLMQVLPQTAVALGYSPKLLTNPTVNVRVGCRHLAMWWRFCGGFTTQGALSVYSGRRKCRPSSYSKAIVLAANESRER